MTKINGDSLQSLVAQDIMSKGLITLRDKDTLSYAAAVFLDKNISGVPVLDERDQPVGVLTKTDLIRYEREYLAAGVAEELRHAMKARATLEVIAEKQGFHSQSEEDCAQRWMTPKVYSVGRRASLRDILREMVRRHIHRIFVRDEDTGRLVGVITSFDLMQILGRLSHLSTSPKPAARCSRGLKRIARP